MPCTNYSMSDAMRVARALCALLILAMGVPAMAVAQYGSEAALAGDPALRPAGNFLPSVARSSPAMDRRVRAVAARPGIAGQVLLVSQRQPEDEFKPISELPPEEKLPAAPMLVAAYV